MFDAGLAELVLIFVVGLLILGPERLPRVAAQLGRWVSRARRTATRLRYQLEREIAMNDLKRQPFKPPRSTGSRQSPPPAGSEAPDAGVPGRAGDDAAGPATTADSPPPARSSEPAGATPSTPPTGGDSTAPPRKPPPAA